MFRLAVIPTDPIEEYEKKGISSWLEDYYNPGKFFDEVYLFSPLEKTECIKFGMKIIPTKPSQFKKRIKEYKIDLVRAYGGFWPCDMACKHKVKEISVIVSVHNTTLKSIHNSIKKADVIFCVSNAVKEIVLEKFQRKNNVWILPNRVNFDFMH